MTTLVGPIMHTRPLPPTAPPGYTDPYYAYYPSTYPVKKLVSAASSMSPLIRYPEYNTNNIDPSSYKATLRYPAPPPVPSQIDTGMITGQDEADANTLLKFQAQAQSASAPTEVVHNEESVKQEPLSDEKEVDAVTHGAEKETEEVSVVEEVGINFGIHYKGCKVTPNVITIRTWLRNQRNSGGYLQYSMKNHILIFN